MQSYSTLISVYKRENPAYLSRALDSILAQTRPAAQIVLVKDGQLTQQLDELIASYDNRHSGRFSIISLERNIGLGPALQKGLESCRYDLVARMDSDDIAEATRCEKQVTFLTEHPDIAAVGSWISEFDIDEHSVYAVRSLPCSPEELERFARRRCPMNHMTVMFQKDSVAKAGGYQALIGFEDYFLWIRMLLNGAKLANIAECLVKVRAGASQLSRRGGITYAMSELNLQRKMRELGFITTFEFMLNVCIRFLTRMSPMPVRRLIYWALRVQRFA
jgi:glycosyltransferase involved in cell wall biosynthesis